MPQKKIIIGGLIGAIIVGSAGFAGGYVFGANNPNGQPVSSVANATVPSDIKAGDFGLFWKTWRLIDSASYKAVEDTPQQRVFGAIKGLVDSLGDPYSVFFTPEENQRFSESVQGAFGGVGIELGIKEEHLIVIAPLKNTPAERAGIKAGEFILEINSSSTDGISVDQAVNQIRGNEGTYVTLSILGTDGKQRDIKLKRERIEIPSLEVKMEGTIAHISLYEFTADAGAKFGEAVRGLPKNTTGIVLDLRNNPGGFLEVAVDIAGWFVPRDATVVKEAERTGKVTTFSAKGPSSLESMPVVVLVNGGSASASEILAGALRDLRKAPLVGETSFGKGTVQEVRDIPGSNGASVKLTVAEWLTPNGARINKVGLAPDFVVKPSTNVSSTVDLQLQKALEVARQQLHK
jgi:carboxyl-terminal processing protease